MISSLRYLIWRSCVFYGLRVKPDMNFKLENPVLEIFVTYLITYFITAIHEAVFFYIPMERKFFKICQA